MRALWQTELGLGQTWLGWAMRILVLAAGSRGDVVPIVALGAGLRTAGHDVTVMAGTEFAGLIASHGLSVVSAGVSAEELIRSDLGTAWLAKSSHNPVVELKRLTSLVDHFAPTYAEVMVPLVGSADLIISGILTVQAADLIARQSGAQHILAQLSPIRPSRSGAVTLQPWWPRTQSWLNALSGRLLLASAARAFDATGDAVAHALGVSAGGPRGFIDAVMHTPTLLGASPLLVSPPADWPDLAVTGPWTLPQDPQWMPRSDLLDFLSVGAPPVYVGFGSMPSTDPLADVALLQSAARQSGVRLVVHRGLADWTCTSEEIFLIDHVPHEWLFEQVAGVVHHGGAGTTHAALRAGVPQTIVAHIGDQPYWARRAAELQLGPVGQKRHRFTAASLTSWLTDIAQGGYRPRARQIGAQAGQEQGVANAVRFVESVTGW